MDSFTTRYFGTVSVAKLTYADGNLAIQLIAEIDGEDVATLSINLPQHAHQLGRNEFFAKTYSENTEIAEDALASGLFQDTGACVSAPFGQVPIWRCR